jgi:23S rRNA pseudouridine2605 synthase
MPRRTLTDPTDVTAPTDLAAPAAIRLNRFLAIAGVAARRKADRLIAAGRVTVNGSPTPPGGRLVIPGEDVVAVDGAEVKPAPAEHHYLAVNKPAGYLTAVSDRSRRPVVMALLRDRPAARRLHPVGRLDLESRGLVLLTDDGELSFRLQHPRHHVDKEYELIVRGRLSAEALEKLRQGVVLEEGRTAPAEVKLVGSGPDAGTTRLRVVLRQGWKRQLRRSFQSLGHRVLDLRRIRIGSLRLGDLPEAGVRELRAGEIEALRREVGL